MESIDLSNLKNLFNQKIIEDINNIYMKFKDFPIIQILIKVIKEQNENFEEKEIRELEQKKNVVIPEYMKFFVENLIERITSIIEDKIYVKRLDKNYNIQIVVAYLFKIIISNFNFFPSHKLVLIIYTYLSYSIWNDENISNYINKYINGLNKDLCECFNSNYINIENKNEYDIKEESSFTKNIGVIELLKEELNINKPYLDFFIIFKNEYCLKDKYYYIMIINYLKKFNKNNDVEEKICIYSLLNSLKAHNYYKKKCNEEIIKDITKQLSKKLINKDIKNIIKYSLKILTLHSLEDIIKIGKEINNIVYTKPKISNEFNNSEEYYKDISNNLFYNIKNIKELPNIFYKTQEKKYWCCIIKLLELLLDENIIHDSNIKLIFYFIITLLSDDLGFKIEKEFLSNVINNFICLIFNNKMKILLYPEISFLFNNDKEFYGIFLNSENEEYYYNKLDDIIIQNYIPNLFKNKDISLIKEYQFKNKFLSLFGDYYLSTVKDSDRVEIFYNSYLISKKDNKYLNILYILYIYYNRIMEENCQNCQTIDLNITKSDSPKINNIKNYMLQVISDENFLTLLKNILKSNVVKESYTKINQKDLEENKTQGNYNIFNYYSDFCKNIDENLKKEIFIFMDLSTEFKAFTFRFLKIIINTSNVTLRIIENNLNNKNNYILVKAYLIFLLLHELNHFIKRIYNIGIDSEKAVTPRKEGGKELIELLFGNHLLNRNINIEQANYILDYGNWCGDLSSFRGGYKSINNDYKGDSIYYTSTDYDSICYEGFLRI